MKTRIEELWDAVRSQTGEPNVFRRVDAHHPLDLYAGIDSEGDRVLLLVTTVVPDDAPSTGAIAVSVQQREHDEWAVIVRLSRPELAELFGRLCQDLVDTTRSASKTDGAGVLLRRLKRWRRLLEPRQDRSLSERELRGLLGELWVLDTHILPRVGAWLGVQSWLGPLDAPQDFLLDGTLIEVKTVQLGAQAIPISSIAQLDASTPLFVGIVTLSPATESTAGAFTPALLLARVRAAIETSEAATNEFALRLAETGYEEDAAYTKQWYAVLHAKYYRVGESFPRLTAKDVPNGVLNVVYEVSLESIRDYEVSV